MNWQVPVAQMMAILLGSVRTGTWMAIAPPFNSALIPTPLKAMLSIGLTLPLTPYLLATVPPLQIGDLLASALLQAFAGVALGFVTALLYAAIQAAGDTLDFFGSFTLAQAFDPMSQAQSSVFGRFYNLVAITILFVTEGHEVILRGFLQSFRTMPLNFTFSLDTLDKLLMEGVAQMFVSGLQIAGPIVAVLFLTDMAFGLLNRVAPALNAFQLGFPAKILLVILLSGLAITVLPRLLETIIDQSVAAAVRLAGG